MIASHLDGSKAIVPVALCYGNQVKLRLCGLPVAHAGLYLLHPYLSEYPKKFMVDPQYIGLFMMLNGNPVAFLSNRSPK